VKRRSKSRYEAQEELNVTNLVDVTFAILVVFMVTAPLMHRGIKVDLPKANAPALSEQEWLSVSIDSEGGIFLDKEETSLQTLPIDFKNKWDGTSPVVVNADEKLDYGDVMTVVGEIRSLGVEKLGFLSLQKK
jgi:biopolymer transport protein TolR